VAVPQQSDDSFPFHAENLAQTSIPFKPCRMRTDGG
jgi:hypothetical protein